MRENVVIYDGIVTGLADKINHINTVEQLMIGNKIEDAILVTDGEIVFATIGQDWYMCIDKEGNFNIHILSNLSQSKYNTIVSEIRSNLDGILGKVDNKEEVLNLINEEFRRLGINEDISVDSDNTSSPSSSSNDSDEVSQIDSMEDIDAWVLDEDFGIEEEDV